MTITIADITMEDGQRAGLPHENERALTLVPLDEQRARDLIDVLTAWLDAPRVAEVRASFMSATFRCGLYECSGNPCHGHTPCGWTGTGADLAAVGEIDPDDERHECPKCMTRSAERFAP